ncbi:MAG: YDG domain-containing protein, partial [Fibromonadaceae bacterium]|nr:YDG domain-containing protein [Fibromonadaceae bacterium]
MATTLKNNGSGYLKGISRIITAAALAIACWAGTAAAQSAAVKISPNGIDADHNVGRHNSYAWSSEVFEQTDGDYLWVGMNRDLGGALLGIAGLTPSEIEGVSNLIDIPLENEDKAGRVYRLNLSVPDSPWEFVYKNDAINGYRKMIVFNGDLYVLAGSANVTRGFTHTKMLRFSKNFKEGDEPEIVMWVTLPSGSAEYFRSATVFGDKLYIGTFDGDIFSTDGAGLSDLNMLDDAKPGWKLETSLGINKIAWDLLSFNNHIYAFVTFATELPYSLQNPSGFQVYKMDPADLNGKELIVGDTDSKAYPAGMGINRNVAASGFLYTDPADGKEYVYVSTFANGPLFLSALVGGLADLAFANLFSPAQIYRFDEHDKWEVVVGDENGGSVAIDNNGAKVPRIGTARAGFFTEEGQNRSFNQYIWWMAEFEGRLYATTWDMSPVKKYYNEIKRQTLSARTGSNYETFEQQVDAVADQLIYMREKYESVINPTEIVTEVVGYLYEIASSPPGQDIIRDALRVIMEQHIDELDDNVQDEFWVDFDGLDAAIVSLHSSIGYSQTSTITVILYMLTVAPFFAEYPNPEGFDLYVSEDGGVTFEPVTLNGFGDPNNYGGRVLVPSKHGLFILTANPFQGAQVWRINRMSVADDLSFSLANVDYNGSPHSVSVDPAAGVFGLGAITIWYEGTNGTIYNKSSTAPTNAGAYIVTADIADGANYAAATNLLLGNFTINKATLAWVAGTVEPKTYDGTTAATVADSPTFDGIIGDDEVIVVPGDVVFADANVNENIDVIAENWTFGGADADNYMLGTQPVFAQASISKKEVAQPMLGGDISAVFDGSLKTVTLAASDYYETESSLSETNADNYNVIVALKDPANHKWNEKAEDESGALTLPWSIAKADGTTAPDYEPPTDLAAIEDQTLADVELPPGWAWDEAPATPVGEIGERKHKATFTPANANYSTIASADWTIKVDDATSIFANRENPK